MQVLINVKKVRFLLQKFYAKLHVIKVWQDIALSFIIEISRKPDIVLNMSKKLFIKVKRFFKVMTSISKASSIQTDYKLIINIRVVNINVRGH